MENVRPRSARRHRVAVVLPPVAIVVAIVSAVPAWLGDGLSIDVWFAIGGMVSFTTVGALIEARRPGQAIDRRFHRARYDAEQTVAGLASTLRDEVDIGRLRQQILDVVERSVEPTEVHLWLRPGSAR